MTNPNKDGLLEAKEAENACQSLRLPRLRSPKLRSCGLRRRLCEKAAKAGIEQLRARYLDSLLIAMRQKELLATIRDTLARL